MELRLRIGWNGGTIWGGWNYFYTLGAILQSVITIYLLPILLRNLFSFVLLLSVAQGAFAAEITPHPLRMLIEKSQYIVVATIENPYDIGPLGSDKSFDIVANLHVLEILNGNPISNTIQVVYNPFTICPKAPQYPNQKTVIAFLNKMDTANTYYTVALSYGSKIMDTDEELQVYKARIKDYDEIYKIKSQELRNKATDEWLVKCAENKYTRWEGLCEFTNNAYHYNHDNRLFDPHFSSSLSKTQIKRLENAFFATDTISYEELCFLNIFPKKSHKRAKKHLLKNLAHAEYYIAKEIMQELLILEPNSKLELIFQETEKLLFDDPELSSKQTQIIQQFLEVATSE